MTQRRIALRQDHDMTSPVFVGAATAPTTTHHGWLLGGAWFAAIRSRLTRQPSSRMVLFETGVRVLRARGCPFLYEATISLKAGAPHAAIVMAWSAAYDQLVDHVLRYRLAEFNAEWPRLFP